MKLINPTDDQLNAAFAVVIDGWKLLPRLFHNKQWKDVPTWVERRFYDGKPEDYCCCGQFLGARYPAFTRSSDLVLPWLDRWHVEAGRLLTLNCWLLIVRKDAATKNYVRATGETFAHAAVIALLRAHGVEIEFSGEAGT